MSLPLEGKYRKRAATSDMLAFVGENLLSVTDLTRTKKLSEILDNYSSSPSSEIYVVQNNKNKHSQAVVADLEYFKQLLEYKEAVDEAMDTYMYQVAKERQDDVADISFPQILEDENFELNEILKLADEIEVEE